MIIIDVARARTGVKVCVDETKLSIVACNRMISTRYVTMRVSEVELVVMLVLLVLDLRLLAQCDVVVCFITVCATSVCYKT